MRVKKGAVVRIPTTVEQVNLDGTKTLVDPTTITGTLTFPDRVATTGFNPVKDVVGKYYSSIQTSGLTPYGNYQWTVRTTGAGEGVQDGSFDLVDPLDVELLSLDDAKQQLNLDLTKTTNDAELEVYVAAVTGAIESYVGPVGRRTVTDVVYPASGVIRLSTTPVLSLTSVTPASSAALTLSSLRLDASAGVIWPGTYVGFYAASYTVVYVAGRAAVPPEVNMAARLVMADLWSSQRGGSASPQIIGAAPADFGDLGGAVAVSLMSPQVRRLLDSYRLAPGSA